MRAKKRFAVLSVLLFPLSLFAEPSDNMWTASIGEPFGIISAVQNVAENIVSTTGGDNSMGTTGWNASIEYISFIEKRIDTVGSCFSFLIGYAYNNASVDVKNIPGEGNQVMNLNMSATVHELKFEGGWVSCIQSWAFFGGIGGVYNFSSHSESVNDNYFNNLSAGAVHSGFGLAGTGLVSYRVTPNVGLMLHFDMTNLNWSLGVGIIVM